MNSNLFIYYFKEKIITFYCNQLWEQCHYVLLFKKFSVPSSNDKRHTFTYLGIQSFLSLGLSLQTLLYSKPAIPTLTIDGHSHLRKLSPPQLHRISCHNNVGHYSNNLILPSTRCFRKNIYKAGQAPCGYKANSRAIKKCINYAATWQTKNIDIESRFNKYRTPLTSFNFSKATATNDLETQQTLETNHALAHM